MEKHVDILILGAGWTSDFLIPLLREGNVSFAATTRDGRDRSGVPTIKFQFDPDSSDSTPFKVLPDAKTVVIVFPIYASGASAKLVDFWRQTHENSKAAFVQLGSTGIWDGGPTANESRRDTAKWFDRKTPFLASNDRGRAEEELLALSPETLTTVMNLAGLWGGERIPQRYVLRAVPTKEVLAQKGSLHLIHGVDVARAIVAVHHNFDSANGQRWLLTDGRIYDWWDLASVWGGSSSSQSSIDNEITSDNSASRSEGRQPVWVRELMAEQGIRALPRPPSAYKRVLDSRDFWNTFDLSPKRTLLEP